MSNRNARRNADSDSLSGWNVCGIACGVCSASWITIIVSMASSVLLGVLAMLIGNSIMRHYHPASYTTDHSAALIGALGGVLASLITGPFVALTVWAAPVAMIVFGCLTGVIGGALFKNAMHRDIGAITIQGATIAGTIGGAILLLPTLALTGAVVFGVIGGLSWWDHKGKKESASNFL